MRDPETAALDELPADREYTAVDRMLRTAGWETAGVGDWAVVLVSPSGRWAARISPFDPAAPYTAELYRLAAGTGLVPRLERHVSLAGGAELTIMERLEPSDPVTAAALHRAIAERAPGVADLVDRIREVHARASAELPWFGPVDDNPANVMRTAEGRVVVTDLFYADGPNLYAAAEHDPDRVVREIPPDRRRHMTEIPVASSGPWSRELREAMREGLAAADLQRAAASRSASSENRAG